MGIPDEGLDPKLKVCSGTRVWGLMENHVGKKMQHDLETLDNFRGLGFKVMQVCEELKLSCHLKVAIVTTYLFHGNLNSTPQP